MKILKVNPAKPEKKVISEAIKVLKMGGVIVYPTDTCYGLGGDITNTITTKNIYKIKNREKKALSMIIKDLSQIKKYAEIDNTRLKFIKKYFPGAITFVLLNLDYQNINMNTIAIRMPDYKVTQSIINNIDFPLVTTSANISGKNVCYTADSVIKQFKNQKIQPDLVLDAGILPNNPPSTVVDIIGWPPRVLRQGSVKINISKL